MYDVLRNTCNDYGRVMQIKIEDYVGYCSIK